MTMLISNLLAFLRRDEEGQTLVEYGLLLALIAIVVIAALIILGPTVSGIFTSVADLRRKIVRYIRRYNNGAKPFRWSYADPSRRIA